MAQDPNTKIRITAQDDATSTFGKLERNIKGWGSNVSGLIKAAFAGVAAMAIGNFFKDAVAESAHSADVWAGVAGALANVGVKAQQVLPHVNEVVNALSRKTGMDDEDIAAAFANLVRRTGDYNKALQLLPQALDVAAAHNMDLAKASDTVAKAHDGNAKAQKLVMNTQGAAIAQGETLKGTLGRISVEWGNFKQSVGDAITSTGTFGKSANGLVDIMVRLESFITDNSGYLQGFFTALQDVGGVVVQVGSYLVDLGERVFGGSLQVFLSHAQSSFLLFRDTLSLVVDGLYNFLRPIADVAGGLLTIVSPYLLQAWRGWMLIVATAGAGLGELGASADIAFGKLLQGLSSFATGANKVLGVLGVHISDSFITTLDKMGQAAEDRGTAKLGEIQDKLDATMAKFEKGDYSRENAKGPKPAPLAPKIVGVTSVGDDDIGPQKDKKDKADKDDVLEEIKQQSALLDVANARATAMARLVDLQKQEAEQSELAVNDTEDRAKAAEHVKAIEKAILDDKHKQASAFKDTVDSLGAQLGLTDKAKAAQKALNDLAMEQKAIADNTKASVDDRVVALERYNAIEKELVNHGQQLQQADEAAFKKKLDNLTAQLSIHNLTSDAQGKLLDMARQQKDIADDTTKSIEDRAIAQARYNDILKEGKLDDLAPHGLNDTLKDLSENIMPTLTDSFGTAFDAIASGASAWASLGTAAKKAIGQMAAAEGRHEFGLALAAFARAFNPNPLISAGAVVEGTKHLAAGAFLTALGGALSASGGGGGAASSGGGPGSAGSTSAKSLDDTAKTNKLEAGETTIVIKGGGWTNDPRFLDQLANAVSNAKGNRIVFKNE